MHVLNPALQILLIEDDEVDIQDIRRIFKKIGIDNPLHIAKDGVEAMGMLLGNHIVKQLKPTPQIILLDLRLPKMDGIEFLKALRANSVLKPIHVFVLTSSDEAKDKLAAHSLNVAGYIVKPQQIKEFVEIFEILKCYWQIIEF